MITTRFAMILLSILVLPSWITAQEPPRVLEDRNGYFRLEGLSAAWSSPTLQIADQDMQNLEVRPPSLQIRVQVTPTAKTPGTWDVGWVLVLEEHYSFTGWKNTQVETRYPRLPFNGSEGATPFLREAVNNVTASTPPFSLNLLWDRPEGIPLREEGNPDPAALGSLLRQNKGALFLVGINKTANLAVVAAEVRFQQAWEVYVDGFLPPGNRVQVGEQIFPDPEMATPGRIKIFPGTLLIPAERGKPREFRTRTGS